MLNPFWTFFNAIFPPILVASIQYYLMDPVVDWMEKKLKVPRIITIILLFVIVVGGLIWIINTLIPIIQHQTDSLVKNKTNGAVNKVIKIIVITLTADDKLLKAKLKLS